MTTTSFQLTGVLSHVRPLPNNTAELLIGDYTIHTCGAQAQKAVAWWKAANIEGEPLEVTVCGSLQPTAKQITLVAKTLTFYTQQHGPKLTPAEAEVLHLLARGLTASEIARALVKSLSTVNNQLNAIKRKLGAKKIHQVVALALRHHLVLSGDTTPA
jgi:DNA-binding CsgD family transcriptional regulator